METHCAFLPCFSYVLVKKMEKTEHDSVSSRVPRRPRAKRQAFGAVSRTPCKKLPVVLLPPPSYSPRPGRAATMRRYKPARHLPSALRLLAHVPAVIDDAVLVAVLPQERRRRQ
jgi:hypothetical protein